MDRLLIVEDDDQIREQLKATFQPVFEIVLAENLSRAKEELNVDLVLLDLNLGLEPGFELIPILYKRATPVIVISVRNDEDSIVKALDMGATDYVTKPFNLNILKSRMNSVLRRRERRDSIEFENINGILKIEDREIILTKTEQKIMLLFLNNRGNVLTRGQLLEIVWDAEGSFIEDNTLTVTMSRLKSKLGGGMIETIRGIGYRWKG